MFRRKRTVLVGLAMMVAVPWLGTVGEAHAAPPVADGCDAGVRSDFNGDGRTDTVVGDPTPQSTGRAGRPGHRALRRRRRPGRRGRRGGLWQGEEQRRRRRRTGDRFGTSLAVADIDCDEYTDLVVGTPNEDINGQADSGYVQIIWGSPAGLGSGEASRAVHPDELRPSRSWPATSSVTRSTPSRTSARAERRSRTRTRWPSGCRAATSAAATTPGCVAIRDRHWTVATPHTWSARTPPASPARPKRATGSAPRCRSTTWPGRPASSTAPSACRTRTSARSDAGAVTVLRGPLGDEPPGGDRLRPEPAASPAPPKRATSSAPPWTP